MKPNQPVYKPNTPEPPLPQCLDKSCPSLLGSTVPVIVIVSNSNLVFSDRLLPFSFDQINHHDWVKKKQLRIQMTTMTQQNEK